MFARDLLDFLQAVPFEPFRIHLTDGSTFEIRHPEMVKVERTKAQVFYHAEDKPISLVLRKESIALLHINRLEPVPPTAKSGQQIAEGNGAPPS